MTLTYVLMQNLRRNPLRTVLTALSFALPMAVFVGALSLVTLFVKTGAQAAQELRIATKSKITLTNVLPDGYRRRIEALDPDGKRIKGVCGFRWFGGKVPASEQSVQALGCDVDSMPTVFSDLDWTPQEVERWSRERRAAVVGEQLAAKNGWAVGQTFTLNSNVPPYRSLEFILVKKLTQPQRSLSVYFRRDYMSESLKDADRWRDGSNVYWIKCHSAAALQSMKQEIDALFANSPDETRSEDENAFAATFQQALGDIPGLMQSMALVVVVIMALVAGNTMMMSFRERARELAVFKAMGYPSGRVFRIVLAESVLLALIGSAIGIIPAALAMYFFPLPVQFGPIGRVDLSIEAVIASVIIALLVGLAAGIVPAWNALTLRTVDALRRVA